jgi:hypothetical protein
MEANMPSFNRTSFNRTSLAFAIGLAILLAAAFAPSAGSLRITAVDAKSGVITAREIGTNEVVTISAAPATVKGLRPGQEIDAESVRKATSPTADAPRDPKTCAPWRVCGTGCCFCPYGRKADGSCWSPTGVSPAAAEIQRPRG